ncbi:MAG: hypothetical protein RSA98_01245 [Odoribacter sp.]
MMKRYMLITFVWGMLLMAGCHEVTVGYLQTKNAMYVPNTMKIRLVLDENLDAFRIHGVAPWVSPKLQGVIGTGPLLYEIEEVKATEGGNAELFRHLLRIRGGGRMEFPLVSDITAGHYTVSVRVYNEGYSEIIKDAFTCEVI